MADKIPLKSPFLSSMIPDIAASTLPLKDHTISAQLMNQMICTPLRMACIKTKKSDSNAYCKRPHMVIFDSLFETVVFCTKDISIDSVWSFRKKM